MIIRHLSKTQPEWIRVQAVLAQASACDLWTHLMPNITVRPREFPTFHYHPLSFELSEVSSHELGQEAV
jgi:hypothetical protein